VAGGFITSKRFNMPHISIIVPVYKAELYLHELYKRLKATLELITTDFEIILVEDCGGDDSWKIIKQLSKLDSRVKGFKFSRNFGQHYGITAGLDFCDGDWVVIMDCDLQDQPEEIVNLYKKAQEGYDIVVARLKKRKHPIVKRLYSWAFYKVFNYFLEINYDGGVGNYRIISRKVVVNFRRMRENLRFFGGLINWMGFPTAAIEVEHAKRIYGKSNYTFSKLWKLASDSIIAYSDKPLRLSIRFGFIMSLLAIIYGIYILINSFLTHSPVPGWSSLIVSIYFIGGIIIGILGIIGIYLGKTFNEVKKRPLYILSETTSLDYSSLWAQDETITSLQQYLISMPSQPNEIVIGESPN
jgi:dolichol-phosphate mannosyltransferase